MNYDLTTFVADGQPDEERLDETIMLAEAKGWIQQFPDGELQHDVSQIQGTAALEVLINRDYRRAVIAAMNNCGYRSVEGGQQ